SGDGAPGVHCRNQQRARRQLQVHSLLRATSMSSYSSGTRVLFISALIALSASAAGADVTIPYNEYSGSPTIGRGNGTSTDPRHPDFGAARIFIQKVMDYAGALPAGQKVVFQPDAKTGRAVNALRAGIQFANKNAQPQAAVSDPSWGFIYNSVPFGMNFR